MRLVSPTDALPAGCPELGIPCDVCPDWADKAWQVISYAQVTPDTTEAYKAALIEYGPLGVPMKVPDDFLFYAGGIYEPVLESEEWADTFPYGQANHWVTLVGYDDAGGYWIVKNSWSADWGEQGYGKILYGDIEKYALTIAIISVAGPDNCKAVTVYNEGSASLNITNVTISYGGDEPTGWLDAERKSFSLSPHRSEGITIWVDTTGLSSGEYHATLNIYSNDPDESPAPVAVTLTIVAANTPPEVTNVTASQGSGMVDISYDVSDTEQSEVSISFEYWDGASWWACITTTGEGTQSTGTGKSGTWNAKTDRDEHYMPDCKIRVIADDGQAENNIDIVESNTFALDTKDPTGYGCSSPVNGASDVSINPDLACLTASDDSPPISYYFQLAENDTFTQGLQESGWQTSTTWSPSTLSYDKQYFWRVKAKDSYSNETDYSSTFNFTTEMPPPADIRTPIDPIDFGDVAVGGSQNNTTIIYSDGTGALTINNITKLSGSDEFSYVGPETPFDIAAGESQTITIRFAPTSEGLKSATFNVNSSDPDMPDVTFDVSGNGVPPPPIEAVTEFVLDLDDDDASGGRAGITEVRDPATGEPVAVLVGGYQAEFNYNGNIVNVLEGRLKPPFDTGDSSIKNPDGLIQFNGLATAGAPAPIDLAFLTMRLIGSVDEQCQGTLVFTSVVDSDGQPLGISPSEISYNFRRGDARADGEVNISDALFIAQYLAGLRDLGSGLDKVQAVNAGSVKHDSSFDEVNISDVLFICQYLVGLRDGNMNPIE